MSETLGLTHHPLPGGAVGYEIRLGSQKLVRVVEMPEGWRVVNIAATSAAVVPIRSRADEMARRIARISAL